MKKQLAGSLILLAATIIWGSAFVSQSVAMEHMGPFSFQAVRCALAALSLLPAAAIADRFQSDSRSFFQRWANPKLWKAGLLCGIPLFLACNLQQLGLVDTDAGKSGFLTAMYIVIVPVLGLFLKKKPSIMVPISVALAVVGMYFLSYAGASKMNPGDLLTIGCAMMFAVQITFVDIFAKDSDPIRLNAIQAFVCAVLSAVVMLFTEQPRWTGIIHCALPLIHTGVLSMGLAYTLQIVGQRKLDATPATLIMSLESVFAALFGAVLLNETMTRWEIFGSCIMFISVILSQIPVKLIEKKTVHPSK